MHQSGVRRGSDNLAVIGPREVLLLVSVSILWKQILQKEAQQTRPCFEEQGFILTLYFVSCAGTIYEGTTNVQLSTMAKIIDKEFDQ